jgi:hypothetical protein
LIQIEVARIVVSADSNASEDELALTHSRRNTASAFLRGACRLIEMLFDSEEELGNRHVEPSRNGERRVNSEVVLPALDAAHIRAVDAAMVRKGFLGKTGLLPEGTDSVAEHYLQSLHYQQSAKGHA